MTDEPTFPLFDIFPKQNVALKAHDLIGWDTYFLSLAYLVSQKSKDSSTKHGAIIVDQNNRVVSMGYNGPPRGMKDRGLPQEKPERYLYAVHAECNAILFAKQDLENCRIYITGRSCHACMKTIAQSGIKEVIFGGVQSKMVDSADIEASTRIARECQIKLTKICDKCSVLNYLQKTLNYILDRG